MFVFVRRRYYSSAAAGEGRIAVGEETTKVILYAYPHLGALAEASCVAAENKARLSFRARLDTIREMELVANELAVRLHLLQLERAVEKFVDACSHEERFLLEYRYFRRRKQLLSYKEYVVPWSERTYYRRQSALLKKAAAFLSANGWSEEEYLAAFSDYQPFLRLERSIRSGRESAVVARREKCGLAFSVQKNCVARQKSFCSRGGCLPRSKITATAIAATHARTMTAICSAVTESSPAAGGSCTSPETSSR